MDKYLRKFRKCYINTDSDRHVVICDQLHKAQPFLRTGPQLVKKFPAFYETPKYITAFKNARRLSYSSPSCLLNIHFNIIPSTSRSTK